MSSRTNTPLVSIVILNYNAGDLLLNCVESVFKTQYDNFEVIIVDNVSKDESHKKCKEKFKKIQLIENKKNFGYCEGNNIGIRHSKGDFIVIMNPDTVVEPTWLKELVSAYNRYGEGIYQPKILSFKEKNVLQSTGNMIHLFGFGFSRDLGVIDNNQHNKIEQIGYAAGTCLFTSSKVIEKVGLFDPFIFLYHDDVDFGWRAAQIGIKSYYIPSAIIYHVKSYNLQWGAEKFFWLERNRRYCLLTHYSKKTYHQMKPFLVLVEILVWLVYVSKGFIRSKIRAELDISRNRKHILQKYEELENKKTVEDKELIKNFPDTIFVSKNISGNIAGNVFNLILSFLSKKAKRSILSR